MGAELGERVGARKAKGESMVAQLSRFKMVISTLGGHRIQP